MLLVTHDRAAGVFVALKEGQAAGTLHYRVRNDSVWDMFSTQVPPRFEGQGIASALAKEAVSAAVAANVEILPTCWFVAGWLDRHPDADSRARDSDVVANREHWDGMADQWVAVGERQWRSEPNWGLYGVPDSELRMLPESLAGLQTIELGCGTGYVSGWLARRGAAAVGLDNSINQLRTARRLGVTHASNVRWVHGNAERLPFADESFDFAVTEYGAVTWVDPQRWVPEAARVLRSGGRLVVFGGTPWLNVCSPLNGDVADRRLHRPYFGTSRIDWRAAEVDPGGVDFNLTTSGWFEIFSVNRFRVERYLELQAPPEARDRSHVTGKWAHNYPAEHAWVLTRV